MSACRGCGQTIPATTSGPPREWCSDRCRKVSCYSGVCVDCGALTYNSSTTPPKRCHSCDLVKLHAQQREEGQAKRRRVEELWAQGMTGSQIAAVMGWTVGSARARIGQYRAEGCDLPHRYPPARVARGAKKAA